MGHDGRSVPIAVWIGQQVVAVRTAIRWTQTDLGRRIGVVQSVISDIEAGAQPDLTLRRAEQLFDAMGARIRVSIDPPRVAEVALRDPVHIRCSAHVVRRLTTVGWDVRTEVEVGGQRSRGWIDILAYHPHGSLGHGRRGEDRNPRYRRA